MKSTKKDLLEKTDTIPFVEFLQKSTNLFVLFSVFTGLFVYSLNLKEFWAAQFFKGGFLLLSIITAIQILIFVIKSMNKDKLYILFLLGFSLILIGILSFIIEILIRMKIG